MPRSSLSSITAWTCAAGLVFSLSVSGCASGASQKEKAVTDLFQALNRTLEASSLKASGTFTSSGEDLSFSLALIEKPVQTALLVKSGNTEFASFYIKDGKTYLDYLGTKSSSLASNLGIDSEKGLSLSNPFLALSKSDRLALFSDASIDGNTYSFTMSPSELEKYIDYYGSAQVNSSILEVEIENDMISSLEWQLDGQIVMQETPIPMNWTMELDVSDLNQSFEISYPADLESW